MTVLVPFLREYVQDKSGMPADQFSAERTEGTFSTLKTQPARPEDSGVNFCASSLNPVLQGQALPVQNRTLSPPSAEVFPWAEEKRGRTRINSWNTRIFVIHLWSGACLGLLTQTSDYHFCFLSVYALTWCNSCPTCCSDLKEIVTLWPYCHIPAYHNLNVFLVK